MPPHKAKRNAPVYGFPDGVWVSVDNILAASTVNPSLEERHIIFTIVDNGVTTTYRLIMSSAKWRSFAGNKSDRAMCDYLRKHLDKAEFLRRVPGKIEKGPE